MANLLVAILLTASSLALSSSSPVQHVLSSVDLEPFDIQDYRLPLKFDVLSYDVRLVPFITEGNFTFLGDVEIRVVPLEDTPDITLHMDRMELINPNQVTITDAFTGEEIGVALTGIYNPYNFYFILLNGILTNGTEYVITIKGFQGVLDNDMLGFYRSSYVDAGQTRWLATTQFESAYARRAFPCFDEPTYKATFTVHISHAADMRAIANMPQKGELELDTEHTDEVRYWTHFETTPRMSTYLVAFVVSDFVYLEDSAKNFRLFAQPPLISQGRYSVLMGPRILDWLADFTGIPFELPKMDVVAVPDFDLGAMENWGLVTYRERLILFGEGVSTSMNMQKIATIVAHEFSHQWFGDLVTPVWWKYLWLNEGFATYFEHYAMAELEPTWRLEDQFVPDNVHDAMGSDASQSSHPMSFDVATPDQIASLFDSITYAKAGSVLRMLRYILSGDTFRTGLNRYLISKSFSNAHPDDLFEMLNDQYHIDHPEATDVDIRTVMNTWTLQMGYPVVTVNRNYQDNTAELTQDRFLLNKIEDHNDTHVYLWNIPLSYTTGDAPNFDDTDPRDWLNVEDEVKVISDLPADQWVLFNIRETGYFRVNYDEANWALLSAQLDSAQLDQVHPVSRAQLLDDSFNLARAGLLQYDTPLTLSRYLARETDFIAWTAAVNVFSFIDDKISTASEYAFFQDFMLELMTEVVASVGFDEQPEDGHVLKLNRAATAVWACHFDQPECIQRASDLLAEWVATPNVNPIKPDLKSGFYCAGVRRGDRATWDFMWRQYTLTNVATETSVLIAALGCSADVATLREYLEQAVTENSPIRKQDASAVFASVYNNPGGVDVALDYLIESFEQISQYFGGFGALGKLIVNIANKCNTQEQADKLEQFVTENEAALAGAAEAAARAVDIVRENLEWQQTNGQEIINWIKDNPLPFGRNDV